MDIAELKKELSHKTEELNAIKEVIAVFLDKVDYDVDDITPDDLECRLRELEREKKKEEIIRIIGKIPSIKSDLPSLCLQEISELCETLGCKQFAGFSQAHNIKFFIKSLSRDNFNLRKAMEGSKRTNGDTRTNNLGSSNTTNS